MVKYYRNPDEELRLLEKKFRSTQDLQDFEKWGQALNRHDIDVPEEVCRGSNSFDIPWHLVMRYSRAMAWEFIQSVIDYYNSPSEYHLHLIGAPPIVSLISILYTHEDMEYETAFKTLTTNYGEGELGLIALCGLNDGSSELFWFTEWSTIPDAPDSILHGYSLRNLSQIEILYRYRANLAYLLKDAPKFIQESILKMLPRVAVGKENTLENLRKMPYPKPKSRYNPDFEEEHPILRISAQQILTSRRSFAQAKANILRGEGTRTKGPLQIWILEDGRYLLVDGQHRFAEGIMKGQREFDVMIVGEGYTDYWATPMPGTEFNL